MTIGVVGLGTGRSKKDLKAGDLYVERGDGYSLLILAGSGDDEDDTLDLVLRVDGNYYDDAKPPYQIYRSGVSATVAKLDGSFEIRPLDGQTAFLQPHVSYGSLALADSDGIFVKTKGRTWVDLKTGSTSNRPNAASEYSDWRIVWRDGDRLETLATFGAVAP